MSPVKGNLAAASCIFAAWLLTACGGGGGGSGASNSPSPAPVSKTTTVSLREHTVNFEADASTSSSPDETVMIAADNVPDGGLYVGLKYSQIAIYGATVEPLGPSTYGVLIKFKDPSVLGPGVYTDTLTFYACFDAKCQSLVTGSPDQLTVHYIVSGVQPPQPTLVLSTSALSAESLYYSSSLPALSFDYAVQNAGALDFYTQAVTTRNAISSVSAADQSSLTGTFGITLKTGSQLQQGVYDDVITLTAVCQRNCPRGLVVPSQTVKVHYSVSDTLSGSNGITVRFLDTPANDLAWSETHQRIYLAVPKTAAANSNTIAVLNPYTAAIESATSVGGEPGVVSLSDDGQYLYAGLRDSGSIRRMLLPGLQQDIRIELGTDGFGNALHANDIEVAPASPNTIAVARCDYDSCVRAAGVVIFDGAVMRPNSVGNVTTGPSLDSLQWDGTAKLYAHDTRYSSRDLAELLVDGNGVQLVSTRNNSSNVLLAAGNIHLSNGLLYFDGGGVYDPISGAFVGQFDAGFPPPAGVIPDVPHNKLFLVADDATLRSYNLTTHAPIASVPVMGGYGGPVHLTRWGPEGLALRSFDGHITLLNGAFVSGTAP